ncbi:hypothetical protein HXX76_002044 [Chlamydomonas incerta]|uniref:U-box domain-containing protein n=1 Tax=Chlamydomonas incerta TaxID=51695 RepID=A0A835WAB9_CHLIN|nr:hypothetical protein HXX76_002044 [Chlamydomonas incerta]|eukprot:KAG2443696.1 hypothetical protein HXX76_002044 [Chlamydomonas incerta]
MEDPVVAADGHTYERKLIEKWMQRAQAAGSAAGPSSIAPRSPMTNHPLPSTVLVPILALRSAIREWQEQQQQRWLQQQRLAPIPCRGVAVGV